MLRRVDMVSMSVLVMSVMKDCTYLSLYVVFDSG